MSAFSGLRQIVDIAHPKTFRALKNAGTISPMSPVAISTALPWLIGRGPSLGVVSQMNAIVLGNKVAIEDPRGSITFKELDRKANQIVAALAHAGIEPGQRVAMVMRNGYEMAVVTFGCQKAGYVGCPMNTWAKPKELKSTLDNAGAKIIFYDTRHSSQIEKAAPDGVPLIAVGDFADAVPGSTPFDEFIEAASSRPPFPFTLHRGAARIIIHTSGTTGTPKGAERDAAAAGLGRMAEMLSVVPYRRDDTIFCPAPLFHSFGLLTFTMATVLGATLVLHDKFDPEDSLRAIEEHKATAASFTPVMLKRIVQLPDDVKSRYDTSSLRIVMASGSAISPDLRAAALELFGPVLYDLYGSTEAGWITIATPEDMADEPKAVGRVVPGAEVALFDPDGKRVAEGDVGEIHVKSDMIFEGYTSGDNRAFIEGFISVGDLGRLDGRGYLYVEGRADDMVVVGGENVYPIEIEEVIEALEGVLEAAVMGAEDPEFGHVLIAYIGGTITDEAVIAHCKEHLASYKVPRRVIVMSELPRTATGKILKRDLEP